MKNRPPHILSLEALGQLRSITVAQPLRVLFSACLSGNGYIYDGSDLGQDSFFSELLKLPTIKPFFFCPENTLFGTPRPLSDIEQGNGFDVLDGHARVLTSEGEDWTQAMIQAGQKMLQVAQEHQVELAILLDMSAACGVQVISLGSRLLEQRQWQIGPGVSAATLIRAGIPVLSQRDYYSLERLRKHLQPDYEMDLNARDHHHSDWYQQYFKPA